MFYQHHYPQSGRPYILDGFESPESAALRYEEAEYYEGGLLARADSPSKFPLMSAYGKQRPQVQGFDNNRPFSESSFAYTAPPYVSQPPGTANPAAYYNAPQMTSVGYGVRPGQYDDQEGAYLNVGSTSIPQVISYHPTSGGDGTRFQVNISALYEMGTTLPIFSIMFNTRRCSATVKKTQQQGAVCQYLVTAEVPPHETTGWNSSSVMVYLLVENGESDLLGKVDVGNFTYNDGHLQVANIQRASLDQTVQADRNPRPDGNVRRTPNDVRSSEELPQYGYTQSEAVAQSSYLQPSAPYGSMMPQYPRQAQYQTQTPQRSTYYPTSSTAPSPSTKSGSSQVSGWTPYPTASVRGTAASRLTRSPGQGASGSMSRPSLTAMPSPMANNPPLIRTSTLAQAQQTPSPAGTPAATGQSGQLYPYSHFSPRASLKIQGNLDSMADDWSYEEWHAKRRLVLFKRSQSGCEITASFKAVTAEERPHHSICISCIYWEERHEMFVTSVDTISLLEKLVDARFTVEEKNRIRRNLEGFRPLTVSKGKAESEEFFKVIMQFPNPKPRNIEKDVKVFPWKILSSALKKIIGKYSASPSSTLPALLTPVSQTGYSTSTDATSAMSSMVRTSGDQTGLVSPQSVSRSVSGASASTAYAAGGSSRTISPPVHKQAMNAHGGPPDLRVSVPNYSHIGNQSHQWANSQQHMPAYTPSHLGDQVSRGSWDLNSYLQTTPTNATPSSIQSQSHQLNHTNSSTRLSDIPVSEADPKARATQASQQMSSS